MSPSLDPVAELAALDAVPFERVFQASCGSGQVIDRAPTDAERTQFEIDRARYWAELGRWATALAAREAKTATLSKKIEHATGLTLNELKEALGLL